MQFDFFFLNYLLPSKSFNYLSPDAIMFGYNWDIVAGPGCSSIGGGAFTELGPFYPTGDGRGLRRNSKSWNKGFSHSLFYIFQQGRSLLT